MIKARRRIPVHFIIALLVLIGITERVGWNVIRPTRGAAGEAYLVAVAVSQGRGFANAYHRDHGATAHVLPISPMIAGGVYALFGPATWLAEVLLACWSIGLAMATYLLLYRAFGRLGVAEWARLVALAFACAAPVFTPQEAVDFRVWEGGLAAFLCALFLDRLLTLKAHGLPRLSMRKTTVLAFLAALLFFVSPPLGLGAYMCGAVWCFATLPPAQVARAGFAAAFALVLVVGPWLVRNYIVMGQPTLRSNLGLELALANFSGATETNGAQAYIRRLAEIHPLMDERAFEAMREAGGEIAYSRKLGGEAWQWATAHPMETVGLVLRHARQFLIPEAWQFGLFGTKAFTSLRAGIADAVGIFGLCGLFAGLLSRREGWIYPALLIFVPVFSLCLFQPVARYVYLFYPMLVFCAANCLAKAATATGEWWR